MISDIFKIRDVPANSTGVYWSVSWPGYGAIHKDHNFGEMWKAAWETGAYSVSFAMHTGETYTINDTGQWSHEYMLNHTYKIIEQHGGLVGVGFAYQDEAEQFVDAMEKIITWKMLSRDYG